MPRPTVPFIALALCCGLALPSGASASASANSCRNADLAPTSANLTKMRVAGRCIINTLRSQRRVGTLRYNSLLASIAQRHCSYMTRRRVFTHSDASGRGVKARAIARGYPSLTRKFDVGEVLAYGSNAGGTPRGIQANWVKSKAHSVQLFAGKYRDIGVGVSVGSPLPNPFARTSATWCVVLGVR